MELELIRGCSQQDRVSQRTLFEMYSGKFMSICRRYMVDNMMAEDVLIESFVKIYDNIDTFKGDGSFEGWMRRIVVNTAINHVKKKNKSLVKYAEEVNDVITIDPSTIDRISANELMLLIHELPPMHRTVFNMFAIDGFTHKEIAERLNFSESNSKWYVAEARKQLKKNIKL